MHIGVIGTGYVGLVHAVTMAEFGMDVIAMDTDKIKIQNLKKGIIPIYEPDLGELLKKNQNEGRIQFTDDIQRTVEASEIIFIAVGTPAQEDGSADLQYVTMVASQIGQHLNGYKIIVDKSTVPVGTARLVESIIQNQLKRRKKDYKFDVASNPEFLREGKAVHDCLSPDRVVIGVNSEVAKKMMQQVYHTVEEKGVPIVVTNIETAEMIKYASNAFLAVKISYINEMALLAEKVGADINQIAYGMGLDNRISPQFLKAGVGYGGSCFPKDTKAIVQIGEEYEEELLVVKAAIEANKKQADKCIQKVVEETGKRVAIKNAVIGIWGLSFKPETDDMRDAPALTVIQELVKQGVHIQAYCPKGMKEAVWRLDNEKEHIKYCNDEYEAAENVDALIIVTEWNQFKEVDMERIYTIMRGGLLFDMRNIFYEDIQVQQQFDYFGIGYRGSIK